MQDVWHQGLETHVAYTCDILGSLEVLVCCITSALSGIVHEVFDDLAQGTTFLAEIDGKTTAAVLCFSNGFLDTECEVRTAGADIGLENIASVTSKTGLA